MSNIFDDASYRPDDLNDEIFLSELPATLLQENIRSQFKEPMEYKKMDFVQTFIHKYMYTKENMELESTDYDSDLPQIFQNFVIFMEDIFSEYLGIGLPTLDELSEDDQLELIHNTYRFFITNIKKNFVGMVTSYITLHSKLLTENYSKKKDVTTLSLKKEVDDQSKLMIISNLGDIIDFIFAEEILVDEFMKLVYSYDPSFETEFVTAKFDSFDITGNFYENYVNMISMDFKSEIESKIRSKLLKKAKKIL